MSLHSPESTAKVETYVVLQIGYGENLMLGFSIKVPWNIYFSHSQELEQVETEP